MWSCVANNIDLHVFQIGLHTCNGWQHGTVLIPSGINRHTLHVLVLTPSGNKPIPHRPTLPMKLMLDKKLIIL